MSTLYYCSDGTRVSQETIRRRYDQAKQEKYCDVFGTLPCEACGEPSNDNDHTIAQARCKVLHKTELIWDKDNFPRSCRRCHQEWENFKGLKWLDHKNVIPRMLYLKEHDPEGYQKRLSLSTYETLTNEDDRS